MDEEQVIMTFVDSNTLSTNPTVDGPANNEIVVENNAIVPIQDIVADYTDVFMTHELFSSRQMLIDWVRARGNELEMVIIVRRSDSGAGKKKPRILLTCERVGYYDGRKKSQVNDEDEIRKKDEDVRKPKDRKETGSKKLGCPFSLRGREVSVGQWSLVVKCGVHNHELGAYKEGHSYVGRLSKVEEEYVVDMTHANSRPKDILARLKEKFEENRSTIRTVYNVRLKNRVIQREGRSQMQQFMFMLEKHEYVHHHRRCEKTNTVKDLFFAHPGSIDLLRAFPKVILMDCTYKTNRYKLLLLEIVGVTSTNITFLIAAAYLENEKTDSYTWACTCLKSLMDQWSMPNVIVTDREIALMNAIERTFPTSRHFLCRWHINKNVLANCRKILTTKEKWDSFNMFWNLLVKSDTESQFNDYLGRLQSEFKDYPSAIKYVTDQWIEPYKERFVSCWTNTVMHYDNTSTSRAESQHASLKRQLGSSQGNFETCWRQIHTLIETSHIAIKHSFEKSRNVVMHKFKSVIYMDLRGMVSIQALNKIYEVESVVGKDTVVDSLLCGCVPRKTCGLPCAHEIVELLKLGKPIPLNQVDTFWRKLDMLPVKGDGNGIRGEMDCAWKNTVEEIHSIYNNASTDSDRLALLKRAREFVKPSITSLIEPQVLEVIRGRPKTKKAKIDKSTKRDPSRFEYIESMEDSYSPREQVTYEVGPSTTRRKIPVTRQRLKLNSAIRFVDRLPSQFANFIAETKDVKADGHCGFRVVASALGFTQDGWPGVRRDLHHELTSNLELYKRVFLASDRVDKVLQTLDYYKDNAPRKHWFYLPEMGHLVASSYNVALVCLDTRMSVTYLPLRTKAETPPKLICMGLINEDHFIEVLLRESYPLPPVSIHWGMFHDQCASGWKDLFQSHLDLYSDSVGYSRVGRSTDTIILE